MKSIFITATGTDIGKTYVTALIIKKLRECGANAGYYKAALSGAEKVNGVYMPGDACYVNKTAGLTDDNSVSYIYKNAVSPHLASKIEGNPVELEVVKHDFAGQCKKYDYVTVEGSGGIVCPIRHDNIHIQLEDIIKTLGLSTLIVADGGLGTINAVVLTVDYMRNRNIPINGIILNRYMSGDIMYEDNKVMIEEFTNLPVVATVSDSDTDINISFEKLESLYEDVK